MNGLHTLVATLDQLGVKLVVKGNHLRFIPRAAVTLDLHAGLRQHKANLLVLLSPMTEAEDEQADLASPWRALVEHLARYGWTYENADIDDDNGSDEFTAALPPSCPTCDLWEMWETLAGTWRCQRCDPPVVAQRLRERAGQIRRQSRK